MVTNFVLKCIEDGGIIKPLMIPARRSGGLGLMNPSLYLDGNRLVGILRNVNYTFYHSEKKLFQHPWGALTYVHPEHDVHLRTQNWYFELDNNLDMTRYVQIDTSKFDTYEPLWEFVGLEDARIFRWEDKLYHCGVRRDTTTTGVGRMELCKLDFIGPSVVETSRLRIDPPNDPDSYCEKNWMPVIDTPYHFVKWSNPTEVVKIDPVTGKSETVALTEHTSMRRDVRGGSQVIPYKNGYIAITHEVDLFKTSTGRKDAHYFHRFIVWDKNWNIVNYSDEFHFMDGDVEFCIGMVDYDDSFIFTFGFQDNAAFVLKAPKITVDKFINGH